MKSYNVTLHGKQIEVLQDVDGKFIIPEEFRGLGTSGLKPACEEWILIRKPLSEKTIAKNVLKHGVGGINIDACRIHTGDVLHGSGANQGGSIYSGDGSGFNAIRKGVPHIKSTQGRFPANLILSGDAPEMLDEQSILGGMHGAGKKRINGIEKSGKNDSMFAGDHEGNGVRFGDSGGASRFFYCPKASKSERGEDNTHPTVKPIKLMEYLCKMITPPGGTVLDPFTGSGSTGVAAVQAGFDFFGIEKEKEYIEIAMKRIGKAENGNQMRTY